MTRQTSSTHCPAPEVDFEAAFERIKQLTGKRTQVELADEFGIRQSSVSDAKKRRSVPDGWLLVILEKYSIAPHWVLTGTGPKMLAPADDAEGRRLVHDEARAMVEGMPLGDLVELLKRKFGDELELTLTTVRPRTTANCEGRS